MDRLNRTKHLDVSRHGMHSLSGFPDLVIAQQALQKIPAGSLISDLMRTLAPLALVQTRIYRQERHSAIEYGEGDGMPAHMHLLLPKQQPAKFACLSAGGRSIGLCNALFLNIVVILRCVNPSSGSVRGNSGPSLSIDSRKSIDQAPA